MGKRLENSTIAKLDGFIKNLKQHYDRFAKIPVKEYTREAVISAARDLIKTQAMYTLRNFASKIFLHKITKNDSQKDLSNKIMSVSDPRKRKTNRPLKNNVNNRSMQHANSHYSLSYETALQILLQLYKTLKTEKSIIKHAYDVIGKKVPDNVLIANQTKLEELYSLASNLYLKYDNKSQKVDPEKLKHSIELVTNKDSELYAELHKKSLEYFEVYESLKNGIESLKNSINPSTAKKDFVNQKRNCGEAIMQFYSIQKERELLKRQAATKLMLTKGVKRFITELPRDDSIGGRPRGMSSPKLPARTRSFNSI